MRRVAAFMGVVSIVLLIGASGAEPASVVVSIGGSSAPEPALRYRLMPAMIDQQSGNASPVYATAVQTLWGSMKGVGRLTDHLHTTTIDTMPTEKLRKELVGYESAVHYAELASLRRRCDWDRPLEEGFGMLLPELAPLRLVGKLICLQVRVDMIDGRYDDAIRDMRNCFALSRNVSVGPTLIETLVGVAIGQLALDRVEEFVQREGSPNLYWALTALPRPFVELDETMEFERTWLWFQFPELREVKTTPMPAERCREILKDICRFAVLDSPGVGQWEDIFNSAMGQVERAGRYLVSHGVPRGRVDAMPAEQVVLAYIVADYERQRDEVYKWFHLPYRQAVEGLTRASAELKATTQSGWNNPLMVLLPQIARVHDRAVHVDRRIAALRCIEAVRDFVATHGGALPGTLDAVSDLPLPIDPVTGGAFTYTSAGDTATLEGSAPAGRGERMAIRYEIRIRSR